MNPYAKTLSINDGRLKEAVNNLTPHSDRPFISASSGQPITESGFNNNFRYRTGDGRRVKSNQRVVASNGELNAHDNKELMQQVAALIKASSNQEVVKATPRDANTIQIMREKNELVQAALSDDRVWNIVGQYIGTDIWETLGREGFSERTLMFQPVEQGQDGKFKLRRKDVIAHTISQNQNVVPTYVRQDYIYPEEYYLIFNIRVDDAEAARATGNLLDEKYTDGLEQVLVEQDNRWKALADVQVTVGGSLTLFNNLTPAVFSALRTRIASWGCPVVTAVLAFDLWDDLLADTDFANYWDPVHKHDIILTGSIGSIYGVELITDGYRHPNLKVLNAGEIYMLSTPDTLGGITRRQDLIVRPTSGYNSGNPSKGWFGTQIEGMAFGNRFGIGKGRKV